MKEQVFELIDRFAPERIRNNLKQLVQNSIRLETLPTDQVSVPLGATRLGGTPDLPEGVTWPIWKGQPLSFIAQINLEEAAAYDEEGVLRSEGVLWFFYHAYMWDDLPWGGSPEDKGSWRVLYFQGEIASLTNTPFPDDLPEDGRFRPAAVQFRQEWTLPPWESAIIERYSLSKDESEEYLTLEEEYRDLLRGDDEPEHRLLGHPDQEQGDMQLECQTVSHGITSYRDPRVEALKEGALS